MQVEKYKTQVDFSLAIGTNHLNKQCLLSALIWSRLSIFMSLLRTYGDKKMVDLRKCMILLAVNNLAIM